MNNPFPPANEYDVELIIESNSKGVTTHRGLQHRCPADTINDFGKFQIPTHVNIEGKEWEVIAIKVSRPNPPIRGTA